MINCELLYQDFHSSITKIDCGKKCAPYNELAVPFCCDTRHAIPTAYDSEWAYLQAKTDLWHLWQGPDVKEDARIRSQTPPGQVLIECKGHLFCEREFRSLTCRSFPFFPYIDRAGKFLGLSYYWEYEDRCWIISNLDQVSSKYVSEFIQAYATIFNEKPNELNTFRYHATMLRRIFSRKRRAITLIHRNGYFYKVSPRSGRMRRINPSQLPKYGPYLIAAQLPFPDENS